MWIGEGEREPRSMRIGVVPSSEIMMLAVEVGKKVSVTAKMEMWRANYRA